MKAPAKGAAKVARKEPLKAPPIPPDVVAWLDRLYPEQCPDPRHTGRQIWMAAGARVVVRRLLAELARQTTPAAPPV